MQLIHVVSPDEGVLFSLTDANIKKALTYGYPKDRSWAEFVNDDIVYNQVEQHISILPTTTVTAKSVTFDDYITFPTNLGIEYTKIEWEGDNGVTVEVSVDGTTYVPCVNGESLPQYQYGLFDTSGQIYIKFTLSTVDASKYIPKLKNLTISFYKTNKTYAVNSGDNIVQIDGQNYFGSKTYEILSRDYRNGLRCKEDEGFILNTDKLIRTIDFFYTPYTLADSGLISSISGDGYSASNYSWSSGTISKTNISAIYINGVNKTSETSLSNLFIAGEIYHIVIVYNSSISGDIKFNNSINGSIEALYQNIGLYQTAFNSSKALEHYDLYADRPIQTISDSTTVSLTESSPTVYDNDWILISTS